MPTVNGHRFERDSKRFALHNLLIKGCTIEQGVDISGWPPAVVRSVFNDVAKDTNRHLLHAEGIYKLGSFKKVIHDRNAKGYKGHRH